MRLLVVTQGEYGKRILDNIRRYAPEHWEVQEWEAPRVLPPVIDYPEDYVPRDLAPADLILSLGENPGLAELLPEIAALTGAKAVIAPVDRLDWLPKGLMNQLERWLADRGAEAAPGGSEPAPGGFETHQRAGVAGARVEAVFPKPFCSLTEESYNYGRHRRSYQNPLIAEFARYFGQPRLEIIVGADKAIEEVHVRRDAACGCACFVAERLVGVSADDAEQEAGLLHHHYPCLASMGIDADFHDTIMHISGRIIKEEVERQVEAAKKPLPYFTPHGRVDS